MDTDGNGSHRGSFILWIVCALAIIAVRYWIFAPSAADPERYAKAYEYGRQAMLETIEDVNNGMAPEAAASQLCRQLREYDRSCVYDERKVTEFFHTLKGFTKMITSASEEFGSIWWANVQVLFDSESVDFVFANGSGCRSRIEAMQQALDTWEGKWRDGFSDYAVKTSECFDFYRKIDLEDNKDYQDAVGYYERLTKMFRRQLSIVRTLAKDGTSNPDYQALANEFDELTEKIVKLAAEMEAKGKPARSSGESVK